MPALLLLHHDIDDDGDGDDQQDHGDDGDVSNHDLDDTEFCHSPI